MNLGFWIVLFFVFLIAVSAISLAVRRAGGFRGLGLMVVSLMPSRPVTAPISTASGEFIIGRKVLYQPRGGHHWRRAEVRGVRERRGIVLLRLDNGSSRLLRSVGELMFSN